jgi:DNA polymerase elongation subunit (family B)
LSYVDALHSRDEDRIYVVERVEGVRRYEEYPANYIFYYDDPRGKFRSVYDTPVARFSTRNFKEFQKEIRIQSGKTLYEQDIKPVLRCLEENYKGKKSPDLHVAFFDIETGFDQDKGFADPSDPFNPITAISVYLDWLDKLVTLVVPPAGMSDETAAEIAQHFDNTFVFRDEGQLLETFLDLIDDADVLSGWNSEGYDIPYTVNRVTRVLSKDDTRKFCLWSQFPKQRTFERFGKESETFDLIGRVHMDYMQLYRKYTYEERHSYSLDAIGEYELGERKLAYEGTLDSLYNKDWRVFIDYNRQDVALLAKLDKKLKFLDLANEIAHENTVLLPTTAGAVAVTEQAIINEAHERGLVVPSRKQRLTDDDTAAAGAYVAYPKKGLHDYIGAVDINSLYPSAIQALNMAPETIVGQLRPTMTDAHLKSKMLAGNSFAAAWENVFGSLEYSAVMNRERGTIITVDWEDGTSQDLSAAEIWSMIFDSHTPYCLSANGTIFTYEREGVVPGLLARWYKERKELQKNLKEARSKEDIEFWDKRQLVKKINLNSLYGAILNPGCRFFDKRIGQSTTLVGRQIARHMAAFINEAITGKYDHVGDAIIYGDTDSCYFSAYSTLKPQIDAGDIAWDKDTAIQIYDTIADQLNASFPGFMEQAFHCRRDHGEIIRGGRELVAIKGLYITKKRYAVMIYDKEGKRKDVNGESGQIKAMGLDLKRADTPRVIQEFLLDLLTHVLQGSDKDWVINQVKEFKIKFTERPAWEKGSPKRVNNLTKFVKEEERLGRANMPGHVRASMNWNNLRRMHADKYSLQIVDGMKVIVCKLKSNPLNFTSVAYPTDQLHLPQWFKDLPFDDAAMETAVIDEKVENLLGVMNWDLASNTQINSTFDSLFSFD